MFKSQKLSFSRKEDSSVPIGWSLRFLRSLRSLRSLRWLETPLNTTSLTHQLDVRQSLCATVGDRTFAIAGARLWNSLPPDIIARDTVPRLGRELKTFLFRQSYPSIVF